MPWVIGAISYRKENILHKAGNRIKLEDKASGGDKVHKVGKIIKWAISGNRLIRRAVAAETGKWAARVSRMVKWKVRTDKIGRWGTRAGQLVRWMALADKTGR